MATKEEPTLQTCLNAIERAAAIQYTQGLKIELLYNNVNRLESRIASLKSRPIGRSYGDYA